MLGSRVPHTRTDLCRAKVTAYRQAFTFATPPAETKVALRPVAAQHSSAIQRQD